MWALGTVAHVNTRPWPELQKQSWAWACFHTNGSSTIGGHSLLGMYCTYTKKGNNNNNSLQPVYDRLRTRNAGDCCAWADAMRTGKNILLGGGVSA